MPLAALLEAAIECNVVAALAEDVGSGDLTAQLVPAGVRHCLNMLFDDMHRTLAQIGRASINDVDESCLEQL